MAETSPPDRRSSPSSSTSSSDEQVSVRAEKEIGGASSVADAKELESSVATSASSSVAVSGSGGNLLDNGGIAQRSKSEINTPRVQMSVEEKSDPTPSQLKLERSKTEGQRNRNLRAEEAAQIYDDKISVQQKEHHLYD